MQHTSPTPQSCYDTSMTCSCNDSTTNASPSGQIEQVANLIQSSLLPFIIYFVSLLITLLLNPIHQKCSSNQLNFLHDHPTNRHAINHSARLIPVGYLINDFLALNSSQAHKGPRHLFSIMHSTQPCSAFPKVRSVLNFAFSRTQYQILSSVLFLNLGYFTADKLRANL